MLNEILIELFERDLGKLRSEIEQYSNEADLWTTTGEISNSAGNLALHLTGNLQHFFGSVLGGTGYVRDRDAEFANRSVSRGDILAEIDETISVLRSTIATLTPEDFAKEYPFEVFGKPMTTGFFAVHLSTHFNYHLGQINYHRRMVSGTAS